MLLLSWNNEPGVLHAEWAENPPLQNTAQRTAFDSRDQESQQVRGSPVVHRVSRLVNQRQTGESPNPVVGSNVALDIVAQRFPVRLPEGASLKVRIRQAGPVS